MIIDAFPLGYGADVLLIRLRELAEVVDRHVIVEADRWHSAGLREPLWLRLAQRPEFREFVPKVHWRRVRTPDAAADPWAREEWLRDETLRAALEYAGPRDRILLGDHDEIPHPEAIDAVRHRQRARLFTRYHEWYLNLRSANRMSALWEFRQPLLVSRQAAQEQSGSRLRQHQLDDWIAPSMVGRYGSALGWHLTLQGGPDEVYEKLQVCAHRELARMTVEEVALKIKARTDILDRCALEVAPDDELPATVQADIDYWRGRGWLC